MVIYPILQNNIMNLCSLVSIPIFLNMKDGIAQVRSTYCFNSAVRIGVCVPVLETWKALTTSIVKKTLCLSGRRRRIEQVEPLDN